MPEFIKKPTFAAPNIKPQSIWQVTKTNYLRRSSFSPKDYQSFFIGSESLMEGGRREELPLARDRMGTTRVLIGIASVTEPISKSAGNGFRVSIILSRRSR